jgi:hypothetical protein
MIYETWYLCLSKNSEQNIKQKPVAFKLCKLLKSGVYIYVNWN